MTDACLKQQRPFLTKIWEGPLPGAPQRKMWGHGTCVVKGSTCDTPATGNPIVAVPTLLSDLRESLGAE